MGSSLADRVKAEGVWVTIKSCLLKKGADPFTLFFPNKVKLVRTKPGGALS